MELSALKGAISDGALSDGLLVFVAKSENAKFLADQYISEICSSKGLVSKCADSIADTLYSPLEFIMPEDSLRVVRVESFEEAMPDYDDVRRVVVVCDKVDKKLEKPLGDRVVEFCDPAEWQIKDYMSYLCGKSIERADIDWLYAAAKGDLHRIKCELDKLAPFCEADKARVFCEIKDCAGQDLTTIDAGLFKVVGDVVSGDLASVYDLLRNKQLMDFDFVGLSTMLLREFKKILLVTHKSGKTPAELGLTDKQAYAIRKRYAGFTQEELMSEITFLSSVSERVTKGELDLPDGAAIDYVVANVLIRLRPKAVRR